MQWFKRLPGFTRSAPGLEWSIWKRLPALLFWATALPLGAGAAHGIGNPGKPARTQAPVGGTRSPDGAAWRRP